MKTIADAIRQLRNTADMLMDRAERQRLRGEEAQAALSRQDAISYRAAANYLEAQEKHDQQH